MTAPTPSADPVQSSARSDASRMPIRRVFVSVYDKSGLEKLAAAFQATGVKVASTGGTRTALEALGVEVEDVSEITGFPEVLDGRVKTLHPKIFAGLLARRDRSDDAEVLAEHGIGLFDAVIVSLYPFERAAADPSMPAAEAIELIDIGGPSLLRAAAKNHAFTSVISHARQYDDLVEAVATGGFTLAQRRKLAADAIAHTAAYDSMIAAWMAQQLVDPQKAATLPARLTLDLEQRMPLRYGENPHQPAAFYAPAGTHGGLAGLRQLSGKELSYNNLADLDAAVRLAALVTDPTAIVVKHTNPCGAAAADTVAAALSTAMRADPTSAFGSIVAVNHPFDVEAAELLLAPGLFVEVIAAPSFDPKAVELLTTKPTWRASVRLVEIPPGNAWAATAGLELTSVAGGLLAQRPDDEVDDPTQWQLATSTPVPADQAASLEFAFTMVRRLSSNAICVCQGTSLVGAGIGQTSRVDAVRHALEKAGERARGGVLASDAFFPFPDSIELAAAAGIAAIVQPGGSKRDPEVIAAAEAAGLPMVLTGRRHFRH
ncbi:MAG: bifunctional phosphoribosylaminoimidazolecarboxamide formyltransferase/IMP cyclohydrolase [Planctomycetota bacterium]|jgi:phosphoribosylaminoimidazolecarboxamide formyltransferase / IMP cyclohydrolase|nr:bifunctional phosphoribosylaminoimidazolecarboxamide formyltransferase/IMP cyclohydrolase [Planctomycetota bacterium]